MNEAEEALDSKNKNATSAVETTAKVCEAEEATHLEEKQETPEEVADLVTELKDEFCSDEAYTEPKSGQPNPAPTPTSCAASAPTPSIIRGLGGVDYYKLSYKDSDSE